MCPSCFLHFEALRDRSVGGACDSSFNINFYSFYSSMWLLISASWIQAPSWVKYSGTAGGWTGWSSWSLPTLQFHDSVIQQGRSAGKYRLLQSNSFSGPGNIHWDGMWTYIYNAVPFWMQNIKCDLYLHCKHEWRCDSNWLALQKPRGLQTENPLVLSWAPRPAQHNGHAGLTLSWGCFVSKFPGAL